MRKIFSPRNILGLLGLLVVGALGSGVWETLFKPVFSWLGNSLLNVATLGKQSLVDGIYIEVAKGFYERAAEGTYEVVVTCVCCFFIGIPAFIFCLIQIERKFGQESDQGPDRSSTRSFLDRIGQFFPQIVLTSLAVQFLFAGTMIILMARQAYIIRAANFLDQSQRIVAPFQPPDDRLMMASLISRIHSKSDFDKIVVALRSVADANKVELPKFDEY